MDVKKFLEKWKKEADERKANETPIIVDIILFIVGKIVVAPFLLIWILNLLLPDKISYTFHSWVASLLLIFFLLVITDDRKNN